MLPSAPGPDPLRAMCWTPFCNGCMWACRTSNSESLVAFAGGKQGLSQQWMPSRLWLLLGKRGVKGTHKPVHPTLPLPPGLLLTVLMTWCSRPWPRPMKNQIPSLVKKALKKERKETKASKPKANHPRTPSPLPFSETSEGTSPCKKHHKAKVHKMAKRKAIKAHKKAHKKAHSPSSISSSSSSASSSASEREEGELSGDDDDKKSHRRDCLFPSDIYTRMIGKAAKCFSLHQRAKGKTSHTSESEPESFTSHSKNVFPQGPSKPTMVPFPDSFQRVVDAKWRIQHANARAPVWWTNCTR